MLSLINDTKNKRHGVNISLFPGLVSIQELIYLFFYKWIMRVCSPLFRFQVDLFTENFSRHAAVTGELLNVGR